MTISVIFDLSDDNLFVQSLLQYMHDIICVLLPNTLH